MAKKTTVIEIYPVCKKPTWLRKGTKVHCLGDGLDVFKVDQIGNNAAFLIRLNGSWHGWESFNKLSKVEKK